MKDFNQYIPISKVDPEKRMVYGYASTEALDSQDEIVDLDAIKAALPDYLRFGNVREMHQPIAAGKVKESSVDEKGWYVGVKVVSDSAWKLVKEQVYNGFSIGGRVTQKVGDQIKALKLSEISLVDRPANPEAVFEMVKFEEPKVKKDIQGAQEALEIAADAEAMALGETLNGEETSSLDASIKGLKAQAIKELAEPEAHEDLQAWQADQAADENAEAVLGEEDVEYADKAKDLVKGEKCDKCNGIGKVDGKKCAKCMGKGVIQPGVVQRFDMPTDAQIKKMLNDAGKKATAKNMAIAKEEIAADIVNKVLEGQEAQMAHDVQLDSVLKKAAEEEKPQYVFIDGQYFKMEKVEEPVEEPKPEEVAEVVEDPEAPEAPATEEKPEEVETPAEEEKEPEKAPETPVVEPEPLVETPIENTPEVPEEVKEEITEDKPAETPAEVETPVETPETPAEPVTEPAPVEAPAVEADKFDSSVMSKVEGDVMAKVEAALMQKFETFAADYESRLNKVETTVMPVKIGASYIVEKFEQGDDMSSITKEIDELAPMLKADPFNPEFLAKREALLKRYNAAKRN